MGCCPGSGGSAIIQAKRELDGIGGNGNMANIDPNSEMVRMEYFGPRVGAVSYHGKRKVYRFGNNTVDRFDDVNPEDVNMLLGQNGFRVIPRDAQKVKGPEAEFVPEPSGETIPAPVEEPEEIFVGFKEEEDGFAIPPLEEEGIPPVLEIPEMPGTVKELKSAVLGAGLDTLLAWLKEEQDGKARKTALEAIEDALNDYS